MTAQMTVQMREHSMGEQWLTAHDGAWRWLPR